MAERSVNCSHKTFSEARKTDFDLWNLLIPCRKFSSRSRNRALFGSSCSLQVGERPHYKYHLMSFLWALWCRHCFSLAETRCRFRFESRTSTYQRIQEDWKPWRSSAGSFSVLFKIWISNSLFQVLCIVCIHLGISEVHSAKSFLEICWYLKRMGNYSPALTDLESTSCDSQFVWSSNFEQSLCHCICS